MVSHWSGLWISRCTTKETSISSTWARCSRRRTRAKLCSRSWRYTSPRPASGSFCRSTTRRSSRRGNGENHRHREELPAQRIEREAERFEDECTEEKVIALLAEDDV